MSSYRIPFASLTGNSYEIRIYPSAEGYDANTAIRLVGGTQPITTEESNDQDILMPVRSSTGYIRIVTQDYNLQSQLMPTTADGMRVTLIRFPRIDESDQSNRVEWEGYIRPEMFSQEWTAGPWEIQLPIISRLGMIMDEFLSEGNTGLLTVGEWLARICGNVYTSVLIPNDELSANGTMTLGSDTITTPSVLQLAFSEELFKQGIELRDRENPTDTSTLWTPGTNREIAASICAVMRWTLREHGSTLICDDPGQTVSYRKYTVANLTTPSNYSLVSMSHVDTDDLGSSWADTVLGGNDGSMDTLLPWGRINLQGAQGKFDQTIIQPSDEDWMKVGGIPYVNGAPASWNRPDTIPYEFYGDTSATIKSQKVLPNVEFESFHYFAVNCRVYPDIDASESYITYTAGQSLNLNAYSNGLASMLYANIYPYTSMHVANPIYYTDAVGGGEICCAHFYYSRDEAYVHMRFNSIVLGRLNITSEAPMPNDTRFPAVKFRSTMARLLPYSSRKRQYPALCISGVAHLGAEGRNIDIMGECNGEGFYGLSVSVKIGSTYICKDTWGSHQCRQTTQESPFDILWTKDNNNEFKEYIPLPMTAGFPMAQDAPIEITIYSPTQVMRQEGQALVNTGKYMRIDNFHVSICEQEEDDAYDFNETLVEAPNSGISLSEQLGSNKLEEYTLNTSFGSVDNPGALFAAIPVSIGGASMSMMQARQVGILAGDNDGARYLCRRTMNWLKTQGASTRKVLKIPLQTSRPWSLPEPMRISNNGEGYFPAAKSIDWREDKTTLTLIEIR